MSRTTEKEVPWEHARLTATVAEYAPEAPPGFISEDEHRGALHSLWFGYGPFAQATREERLNMHPAFGGEMQPGLYSGQGRRKFANAAPMGLSAFALSTFVLSLIHLGTLGLSEPSVVISLGFGYGGLVQILAGMWEMAIGNTFGATSFTSYGAYWVSYSILLTPGGFGIEETVKSAEGSRGWDYSMGLFEIGWFIFTFLLLLCTLKSTVGLFLLFLFLDMSYLMLGIAYLRNDGQNPHVACQRAGGAFGIAAAFVAWYNAYAGIADTTNSFVIIPAVYFPWTERGRKQWGYAKEEHVA